MFIKRTSYFLLIFLTLIPALCFAEKIDIEKLANAIYRAENSTAHPYGILKKYKTTTPRQACLNTIKSARKRYAIYKGTDDFITFLGRTYCPVGCDNDNGTNQFWVKNVKYFLEHK